MQKLITLAFLFLLFCPCMCFGQEYVNEASASSTLYTQRNGLVDNLINDLQVDSKGYVWLATEKGLSRFDGLNFFNFNVSNTQPFFVNAAIQQLLLIDQQLYLVSKTEGVIAFDLRTFKTKQLTHKGVGFFAMRGDTAFYVFSNGAMRLEIAGKIRCERKTGPFENAQAILLDKKILLAMNSRIPIALGYDSLQSLGELSMPIIGFAGGFTNTLLHGVLYFPGSGIYNFRANDSICMLRMLSNPDQISHVSENSRGDLAFIANNRIPCVLSKGRITTYPSKLVDNLELRKIVLTNDQKIICSTNQGLMVMSIADKFIQALDDNVLFNENSIRVRRKIIEAKANELYLLGYPGIVRFDIKTKSLENCLPSKLPTFDGIYAGNSLYFTTEGDGLFNYDLKTRQLKKIEKPGIGAHETFYSIAQISDRVFVVGGDQKIVFWNPIEGTSRVQEIPSGDVFCLAYVKKWHTLFMGAGNDLYALSLDMPNGSAEKVFTSNTGMIRDLFIHDETIWVGSDNNLAVFKANGNKKELAIVKTADFASQEKITAVIMDRKGRVWVSTYRGLFCVDTTKASPFYINKDAGLQNEEYNYKSAICLSNGKLMFGGLNKYDLVDTKILDSPKEHVHELISGYKKVNGKQESLYPMTEEEITFNAEHEDLYLYVSSLKSSQNGEYKYSYRLDEQAWVPLEQSHIIRISKIQYGHHRLTVQLYSPLGEELESKTIAIWAHVPFYKTYEFVIFTLMTFAILTAALVFYIVRSNNIERKTKAVIAMDLHDETGSLLTQLLLSQKADPTSEAGKARITEGLQAALFSMRTFLKTLANTEFMMEELEDELNDFAKKSLANNNIVFKPSFDYAGKRKIPADLYKDIRLCTYEAITNIIKYANCSEVALSFKCQQNHIVVEIEDNGTLHSLLDVKQNGNGLHNIRKRTKKNNGLTSLEIGKNGHGLKINMEFSI